MSIALDSSSSNRIERSGLRHGMSCGSEYDSPDSGRPVNVMFSGDLRLPAAKDVEDEVDDSSSSSSIGVDSDLSDGDDNSGEGEVQSSHKGTLDNLDDLEEVLPMKRGISSFYSGKSKSFTSLTDATSCSTIKEIVKPENPYSRKRRNLLAYSTLWDKNRSYPPRSNSGGISKKPFHSSRSTLALAMTMSSYESNNNSESSGSNSSSPTLSRPPLYPQSRRSPNNEPSLSSSEQNFSPWRSFSLSDLQCATTVTPSVNGLVHSNGQKGRPL